MNKLMINDLITIQKVKLFQILQYNTCNHCSHRNVYMHIYCNFDTTKFATVVQLAKSFGLNDYDICGFSGTVYGLNNKQMKRDGCNERNYNKILSKFYQREKPYSNLIYSIYEQTSGKKYYWQLGCKYEFILMHRPDVEIPQISKKTQLEDSFQQLRTLRILTQLIKFQNYRKFNFN